ncbi:MAG: galactose mutarotase, partial [Paracoccaceae bacterium]|nr:galactose mutarotase [Paracoccaceae bacterium]
MHFGSPAGGRPVERLTIAAGELTARILTFGAALQDLRHAGVAHPLTLGSENLADYEGPMRTAGTIVGPVANRIAGATAMIDGQRHRFEANEGRNTIHGGSAGTQGKVWELRDEGPAHVTLGLTLADGEGGFPGTRRLTARFAAEAPAR